MEACQPTLNNPTTEQNVSEQKWGCYGCLHKFGLFVFVLLKMVMNLWLLQLLFMGLSFVIDSEHPKAVFCLVLLCIAIFIDVFDMVMGLVIIISVCLKCQRIMELYYRYNIYVFVLLSVLCCIILYTIIPAIPLLFLLLIILIWIILLQVLLNYMVKDEFMKLKSSAQIHL